MAEDRRSGFAQQIELSLALEPTVVAAVQALAEGDIDHYLQLLSPNLVAEHGAELIRENVEEDLAPFFGGCVELSGPTTVLHTTDPYGSDGLAFYKFAVTEDGEQRPFAIWIVKENDEPVVAGVLPGASYKKRLDEPDE